MGLRVAVANGNWSNPATWDEGVLPTVGDIVASNGFTVTINQDINIDVLTNTDQTNYGIIPIMTSDTTPEGVAFTNNYNSGYEPYKAFDSTTGTSYFSASTPTVANPIHLGYEFTSAKIIVKYLFSSHPSISYAPVDWTFEGYDGTNWVVLHTVVGHNVSGYTSPVLTNTVAYTKYRLNVTKSGANNFQIKQLSFFDASSGTSNAVAGGGFILNDGVTCTLTNTTAGIFSNSTTPCVTYSATSGTSTINGIIRGSINSSSGTGVLHSGSATLNINGDIQCGTAYAQSNNPGVRKTGTGTLSIVGNLYTIVDSNGNSPFYNTGTGTINITGNLYGHTLNGYTDAFTNSQVCTINITGNVYAGTASNVGTSAGFRNSEAATINVIGNVYSDRNNSGIVTTGASSLTIIGILSCNYLNSNLTVYPAVSSTSSGAINLFTGPFISSPYGTFPYQVIRMHLIPSISSYIEFRDETTNGAVLPGAIAPATQLVSPASVPDGPAVEDVRLGTVYALGTLIGTLNMPHPNQVTFGVAVDNTFGTAVLTAASVWDYLVSNITVEDSIGMRLKNVSTPQTTGEQLEAFLRLD